MCAVFLVTTRTVTGRRPMLLQVSTPWRPFFFVISGLKLYVVQSGMCIEMKHPLVLCFFSSFLLLWPQTLIGLVNREKFCDCYYEYLVLGKI